MASITSIVVPPSTSSPPPQQNNITIINNHHHPIHLDDLPISMHADLLYSTTSTSPTTPTTSSSPSLSPPTTMHPPPHSYKLTIRDLSYTVHSFKILTSVSFSANPSEILAIVGPSGAGKSTLLRSIAGRADNKNLSFRSISINSHPIKTPTQLRRLCGFVPQEDNLLPLLTVKESLMYAAEFALKGARAREKEERVAALMQELGLSHIANSFIGDADDESSGKISGGERKRVSIGIDVMCDPPVLLLDEPTSGLDSSSAFQVIELLATMARVRRQTVVVTIHQPSYRILRHLSSFVLLWRGSVAHHGTLESLEYAMSRSGFRVPPRVNALEFAMEIVGRLKKDDNNNEAWVEQEEEDIEESIFIQEIEETQNPIPRFASRLTEVTTLCSRFWKIIYRTKQLFLARTAQAIVGGFGLGSVYINVKHSENAVAERLGFFAFSLSFLLSSTVEALPIFLQERRVLMREASRGAYRLSSYVVANALVFAPFLLVVALLFSVPVYWLVGLNPTVSAFAYFVGVVWIIVMMASSLVLFLSAISPDFIVGNSLICTFLGAFFLFSGYFIPKESIPNYWIFMYYASMYKYPLDAMIVNEYWSKRSKCFKWGGGGGGGECVVTGRDVLIERGLDEDIRWLNVGIMSGFFVFYRVLCWGVLVRKASKTML
ncbi:ABC transporter G family member 23 [Acorus calamus]|uniref:ABC transporter G family member 23 n=1 Tax=Acorus calamus TaxID=4465 RepID=A0AAV9ETH0_ACOCL|nr:ABC transporter G family member 23 [Acorus calamus]